MKKRFLSILMAFVILGSCIPAAYASEIQPRASEYLSHYLATLSSGKASGQVDITFSVTATGTMTRIGVFRIEIYKSNGTYVASIYGSTGNGLIKASASYYSGVYTYSGDPGTSYYAVVTLYAGNTSGSDTGTITTNTAKAP